MALFMFNHERTISKKSAVLIIKVSVLFYFLYCVFDYCYTYIVNDMVIPDFIYATRYIAFGVPAGFIALGF